ncbi:bridge-like lipid transfer protein family member 1 isoform X2 [Bacillus rossius redtenbacheri]|uniref:bridge-like lipid transfer protein family member 1 isoform X2 n=1 Tax=Bacillus rossius redtenbacheri TaxID=93214 RepID=UPI002FDDEE37
MEEFSGVPKAASWNLTDINKYVDFTVDSSFAFLMFSLLSAIVWVVYITYYNSRVVGYFVTRLLNRLFIRTGYVQVGSLTCNVLSGKIMFRSIVYITHDFTVRIQDGWLIFRWWRSYVPRDVSEDLSHSDTRLSVMVNGFELHVYNRSEMYAKLESLFGLDPQVFPRTDDQAANENGSLEEGMPVVGTSSKQQQGGQIAAILSHNWRDLIPVIKVDVTTGHVVFGNRLVPTTLSVNVEEAHFVYSTKPAASRLDHFMHFIKCKAENFKVILAPSPKYTGMIDDPPRYMGEGFVILSSNNMELYYYMDEAGVVPEEPLMLQLANGDIVESAPPIWGVDIKCGKGTDFSYGPWADRQREHLFKFFLPNDYQPLQVTKVSQPGEKRRAQSFDIRLSTLNEATVDLLFSKNKETNAVHINVGPGSYLEVTMPWVVQSDGYTTKITGQLLHLEATTSLQYRSLVESETMEFTIKCHYPIRWNDHQEWLLNLTGCKATVNLIYAHKWFFQDMINDWASKAHPDLLHFVPYTWKLTLLLKEFEIITLCNEFNWIDCSSQNQENAHMAFCGELFDLSFDLPFKDFLPVTIPLHFWIQGESVDLALYLPEVSSSHCILLALDLSAKVLGRNGNVKPKGAVQRKWRNVCQRSSGWVDCWAVPIVALCINYTYHPAPPLGPPPQANITTPEKEEILLSPIRIPRCRKSPAIHWAQDGSQKFDPTTMAPDKVNVDLEIGPSELLLYGSLLRGFLNLKENIFGEYQSFTDMQQSSAATSPTTSAGADIVGPGGDAGSDDGDPGKAKMFDPRQYRPFEVTVSITMHDIHAHLVKNCNEEDPPCPVVILERFGFEMKKEYRETQLQLLLSPATLLISDSFARSSKDAHLAQGHLMLSGLQVRGHAMFSDEGRTLDQETVEYAWLVEIQLGKLSGKLTASQLHHLVTGLETFLLLARDAENNLRPPRLSRVCHHGLPPLECARSDVESRQHCPAGDDLKYRMTRLAVDALDLYLVEHGTAVQMWASPVRVATCNLHGHYVRSGVTGVLPAIQVRQFVTSGGNFNNHSNTNTASSGRSHAKRQDGQEVWLEVGSVSVGPLTAEAAVSIPAPEENLHTVQHSYLRMHDKASKRLWFLWVGEDSTVKQVNTCGCIGGCVFFGNNHNGLKFFKPSQQDVKDGVNMAAFRINEPGKDPGFGQSILHKGQLVFHTPPYDSHDILLQEPLSGWDKTAHGGNVKVVTPVEALGPEATVMDSHRQMSSTASPSSVSSRGSRRHLGRRFSYTSAGNRVSSGNVWDVPYAPLVDNSPTNLLPPKLDSDSKLNSECGKSILNVPESEPLSKSSISDSKLAVDYFTSAVKQQPPASTEGNMEPQVAAPPSASGEVTASDSHHSLAVAPSREDAISKEVQRTVSMSSENHSEAFYSADEEVSPGGTTASRTSSLRHSGAAGGMAASPFVREGYAPGKKFSSELSIVPSSSVHMVPLSHTLSTGAANVELRSRLSSHRSDHEIHTQEYRKNELIRASNVDLSPVEPAECMFQCTENTLLDSSDSRSVSSTSFISAMSSQEDITLVNLHMQINKPIIDSPLLMSSYVTHLSQVGCSNWTRSSFPTGCDAFTTSLFQRIDNGSLVYIGGKYSPRFQTLSEGFTSFKMIGRNTEQRSSPPTSGKTQTFPYAWDPNVLINSEPKELETDSERELLLLQNDLGTRTTVVIKLKGDMDVMVTPLVLESLQRFIDAVTPSLATQHPHSMLNRLHAECLARVEGANILKRDRSLSYLSQLQAGSKRSTAERDLRGAPLHSGVYEESVCTQTQGTVILPKINITVLQASVVEEIISFSALDNIRDLTCVSLLAICFENITTSFHFRKQAREVVQTFHRPAVLPSGHKKSSGGIKIGGKPFVLGHQSTTITPTLGGEPVYIETSEKQQEEILVTLNVGNIHTQLRRLRNESSILKDAVITAIPAQYSRVLFTCARVMSPMRAVDYYFQQPSSAGTSGNGGRHSSSSQGVDEQNNDDKLGFIMFECGLEGVSIRVVKRSQFDKDDDETQRDTQTDNKNTVTLKDDVEVMEKQQQTSATGGPSVQGESNMSSSAGPKTSKTPPEGGSVPETGSNCLEAFKATKDNTSSCVIEFKTVWFNFAAPPRAPITRKIDFTRLDWNLLSTASPAINAWMNPSNRFAIRVVHMVRCVYRRSTAIVACLMAEALDEHSVHLPIRSRYGRFTPLAKTLQEDPSCQLCCILRKYMLQTDLGVIEAYLKENELPLLSTLRQGIIVLSRQWKFVVYTPLLLDHNYKSKHIKPLNVTFTAPELDEENVLTDGEGSGEECEVTDECAMLLNTHGSSLHKGHKDKAQEKSGPPPKGEEALSPPVNSPQGDQQVTPPPGIVVSSGGADSLFNSPSPPSARQPGGRGKKKKSLPPSHPPSSSRASIVFPIMGVNPFQGAAGQRKFDIDRLIGYGPLKEEHSCGTGPRQLGSNPSLYSGGHGSQHSVTSQENNHAAAAGGGTGPGSGDDLYSWMAKQQDFVKTADGRHQARAHVGAADSKLNTMTTEDTLEETEYLANAKGGFNLYPMHDSLRLLDAHLIFEPLLSCLGVMPRQMISKLSGVSSGHGGANPSTFDTWGSNLTLVGGIETLRIDIVVSEHGRFVDKKKGKAGAVGTANKNMKNAGDKFYLDIPQETPAFLCEKMSVELDLKKMADMTVDEMIQKQNILYISRGQLKKHTSSVINISLNVRYISQQVNMPLLRLLHQISNMYQNAKETQMELKEQEPEGKQGTAAGECKDHKNGSSSTSDLQEQASVSDEKLKEPFTHQGFNLPMSLSQQKMISPSSSLRSRPQSFAQKLRSTSKSVKGYMNLNEGITTPMFAMSPSGSGLDHVAAGAERCKDHAHLQPRCWRTVYYLLDLYAIMPETKTITHRFSVTPDVAASSKTSRKPDVSGDSKVAEDVEKGNGSPVGKPQPSKINVPRESFREVNVVTGERTRLVLFGVARIHRTRLLATLSGLKLEAEITSLHSSLTCRKKSRPASMECSLTGQVGRTMIVLLEGVAPSQQTVVKVTFGKSQTLYSSISRRSKDKNSGFLTIGAVNIDIPQHPVALHGMMTRGSKQLSSTLQELRTSRAPSRMCRGAVPEEVDSGTQHSPRHFQFSQTSVGGLPRPQVETSLLQPLVMQFSIILQSLSITAALLPSLQAQYKMDQVNSTGVTGGKAKFTIDLPQHSLSFTTKLQVIEANLPSEASIELPKVHVSAEYIQDGNNAIEAQFADGVVLRQGSYLSAVADIGVFEHSLTTDLLNHLVFVQKVFMKEVNEVVQKVYGGEKPVPLWLEGNEDSSVSSLKRILFSLVIRIKRIQLTATTPTNSAVRLETGAVEFQLSNRVQNVSGSTQPNPYMKIFGKAQVDINLSLGQLLKNVMFEEAEPEFQQYAFFKTRIGLRNAFQDEMVEGEDKEMVLITLCRPLVYVQPMAVDKAILVWLNYKNAYEYWNEQRSSLNKEVLTATQQVFEKVPFGQLTSQLSSPHLGMLFLQLTVDDLGICLPLNPLPPASWGMSRQLYDLESHGAVVVTLESTSISACSSGSLVSKGRFVGLCLRFADDFETSLDDWKPDMSDSSIMNLCVVSEGTYEVCSRTIAQKQGAAENAKWILNVQWQMEGVDIHLDVNVGKQLSALGHTLTMLTGSQEDEEPLIHADYDSDEADHLDGNAPSLESISVRRSRNLTDSLPAFVFDPNLDAKKRSKLIEKEMNEQAKIINDLRSLGASHGTIEQEMKRLQELEAMVFKDFRRDMIQKLRRQSVKASSIKGKFGLGSKSSTYRSRSFIVPSPTPEHHIEMESPDVAGGASLNSNGTSGSFESSPRSGPSRSASLRVRGLGPRVTFSDTHNICRQSSLPSAGSDLSLPEGDLDWPEHIDIDGEKVELRRKSSTYSTASYDYVDGSCKEQGATSPASYAAPFQKPQEPSIDFELDVKVFINSGKCVLHTKDPSRDDELKLMSRMKKERSCSGGMFDFPPPSPNMNRRNKDNKYGFPSSSRLRYLHGTVSQLVDLTIFHIPGLDVKVHYESKILHKELPRLPNDSTASARKSGTKKASLFAWMTLQTIPEETIISPHILEFLEQTLEPLPSNLQQAKSAFASAGPVNTMFAMDQDSSWVSAANTSNYVYASFPVDVIVYFHMQPSTFRFSCLPVSRVECMLQLPSLDIVFSSKRAEEELNSEFSELKMSQSPRSSSQDSYSSRFEIPSSAVGGLSVTGCLADFSVYIFHPYGGGKKTGLKEAQWSPLADSERKDSLSVNVEFVKFHLSRSRKLNFQLDQQLPCKGLKNSDQSQAVIRFSTIIDVGSASFKYDMRRLTEILAFPKAWYRRSIVRRLFLGDLTIHPTCSEGEESSPSSVEEDVLASQSLGRDSSGRHVVDGSGLSRSAPTADKSPLLSTRERLRLSLENDIARHSKFQDTGKMTSKDDTPSPLDQKSSSAWETLVLFAVNFTKLNVHMNMGNVMGNVMWLTKDFRSEGRLSIGSTGHKNMYVGIGLGGSSLDAKGGIVGGAIELSKIDTYIHIREDPGTEPDHTVGLKLFALELRLDYMGTGVLMSRVSALSVSLRDEWKIHRASKPSDAFIPTRRPAMIFMHGDLGWDQLQLMISKSTTADLLKMFYKLDEFFSQQFKSSKRVFSSLQPRPHPRSSSFKKKHQTHSRKKVVSEGLRPAWTGSVTSDARHHRHWQRVLSLVAGVHLSTLSFPLPVSGTVLGGTMELHGNNISLACFHGINFKSKSWALFSLKEPCISFATEAQEVPSGEVTTRQDVHVVQTLTFSLGMMADHPHAQHHSMATVCRISRNVLFPPQFRTLQEWFYYAFSNSEMDAVDRFPSLEREKMENSEQQRSRSSSSSKLQDPNHTREVIFALPSLQLHLKTEHLQTARTPEVTANKPTVECSFITEFEDHIFVTVDAEAFFFLHDLITSYVKEKERVITSSVSGLRTHSPDNERRGREFLAANGSEDERKRKAFDPAEIFTKDWRNYHCKTWHLEPTVRLLSWAGKSIEPYGVDYILQKLGFSHARTTIPKWVQRGFMDPLDKVLALLMLRMIAVVREEPGADDVA